MLFNKNLPVLLQNRLSNSELAIYLFHGVIEKQVDPVRNYTGKHLEKELFVNCMKTILRKGVPISMDEVLYFCENNLPFPKNAFAVTFDDGFENNISIAAPILADLKIPATIYITTKFINENSMSWIDRIELVVQDVPNCKLKVNWSSNEFCLSDSESRISFLRYVREYVKNTPICDPNLFSQELCERLGNAAILASNSQLDLKMNWDQVAYANQSGFLTIGGHSHTHPILSFLNHDDLAYELDTSLGMMSAIGVSPIHYSYPEGLKHCFSETVIDELKLRGVKCCPTAIDGVNSKNSNPFLLNRIMVNADCDL